MTTRRNPYYRGMMIVKHPNCDSYQVRWYQHDIKIMHTWSPWCDSIKEAEAVIDKLNSQLNIPWAG